MLYLRQLEHKQFLDIMQNTASFCAKMMVSGFGAAPHLRICSIFRRFGHVLVVMEVFIQKLWKEDEEEH